LHFKGYNTSGIAYSENQMIDVLPPRWLEEWLPKQLTAIQETEIEDAPKD
jgi:hypothetical protein